MFFLLRGFCRLRLFLLDAVVEDESTDIEEAMVDWILGIVGEAAVDIPEIWSTRSRRLDLGFVSILWDGVPLIGGGRFATVVLWLNASLFT